MIKVLEFSIFFEKLKIQSRFTCSKMRFSASILCILYLTLVFKPLLPFLDYQINRDFIAQNLCEKKNDPIPICGGTCYLNKELKKASEGSESSKSQLNFSKLISETCFYSTQFVFKRDFSTLSQAIIPIFTTKNPFKEYFSILAAPPEFC